MTIWLRLVFYSFLILYVFGVSHARRDAGLDVRNSLMQRHAEPLNDDLSLSDTVILASVDGKFHALNRTNGRVKWSMHTPPSSIHSSKQPLDEPPLHNLVRSTHHDLSSDDDDVPDLEETYIIEPQSGEIFVLPSGASQSTPLEKLPFTIPQLVDLSPFRLTVHNEQRMFLGRKETSFITLDFDTGAVISIDDTDSCIWHEPPIKTHHDSGVDAEETMSRFDAFDEMAHTKSKAQPRREIVIGRTDYHLTVRTDARKGVVQTLKFSVYGPNSADRDLQERWSRPLDGRYLQPLPDGRVFSFRPRAEEFHSFEWLVPFPKPT